MATARSVITDACRELNVLGEGESLTAFQAALGLQRLQGQLDTWAAQRLTIAVQTRVTFTLPSGQNTRTIGVGGQIAVVRPMFITACNYVIPGTNPGVETPMGEMDDDSYAALSIKDLTSPLPQQFYYNKEQPAGGVLGTLFFWPTVTQDVDLALYLPTAVGIPATLDSTLVGPPGYAEAFMYQLAIRLARPLGRAVSQDLMDQARDAFAVLKRPNVDPGLLGIDAALVPTWGGAYNVYSDSSSGSSNNA